MMKEVLVLVYGKQHKTADMPEKCEEYIAREQEGWEQDVIGTTQEDSKIAQTSRGERLNEILSRPLLLS